MNDPGAMSRDDPEIRCLRLRVAELETRFEIMERNMADMVKIVGSIYRFCSVLTLCFAALFAVAAITMMLEVVR